MGTTTETRMALPYWNHNASYYGWVRREVAGFSPVLDVGCGDGSFWTGKPVQKEPSPMSGNRPQRLTRTGAWGGHCSL